MRLFYCLLAFILMTFSFYCNSIEYDYITSMLIEYPLSNIETREEKGLKGAVAEVNERGYRLLVNEGVESLYVLPSSYYKFSVNGFLEKTISDYSYHKEESWHYENDRLIQLNSVSESRDGRNGRSVLIDFKYDGENKLTNVASKSKTKGVAQDQNGCTNVIMKANTIYSRYCHGGQEQIYTFNDDHKVVMIEKVKLKDSTTAVLFNENIKTIFYYNNGQLSRSILLHDNVKKHEIFTEYDKTGSVSLKRIKQFNNNEVIVEEIAKFDENGNEASHEVLQEKPLNHNPIFGEFNARSRTKTDHVQKNDRHGNVTSLVSTFYKIGSDQSEKILKKEFKYFTYKYYEDKK